MFSVLSPTEIFVCFLGAVFHFDKSTSTCISTTALLPDPYESERYGFPGGLHGTVCMRLNNPRGGSLWSCVALCSGWVPDQKKNVPLFWGRLFLFSYKICPCKSRPTHTAQNSPCVSPREAVWPGSQPCPTQGSPSSGLRCHTLCYCHTLASSGAFHTL